VPTPTISEICAPCIMRLKRSRPRSSVPSRCCADGGRKVRVLGRIVAGLYGVQKIATIATRNRIVR
jgi:hypothetical protein